VGHLDNLEVGHLDNLEEQQQGSQEQLGNLEEVPIIKDKRLDRQHLGKAVLKGKLQASTEDSQAITAYRAVVKDSPEEPAGRDFQQGILVASVGPFVEDKHIPAAVACSHLEPIMA
jgi:hypothetical protein